MILGYGYSTHPPSKLNYPGVSSFNPRRCQWRVWMTADPFNTTPSTRPDLSPPGGQRCWVLQTISTPISITLNVGPRHYGSDSHGVVLRANKGKGLVDIYSYQEKKKLPCSKTHDPWSVIPSPPHRRAASLPVTMARHERFCGVGSDAAGTCHLPWSGACMGFMTGIKEGCNAHEFGGLCQYCISRIGNVR